MYKHLEHVMRKELQTLEDKYRNDQEMSEGDLRRADLILHSLKSMATYCAMKEAEDMQNYGSNTNNYMNNGSNSYMSNPYNARGYNTTGRTMSGYMSPDMSGRYPMYPEERRW